MHVFIEPDSHSFPTAIRRKATLAPGAASRDRGKILRMTDHGSPASERRAYKRHEIWFPVTLVLANREVWGISRDVSSKGLLMSSMVFLQVGELVEVTFRVMPGRVMHKVTGRVVRYDENL